MARDAAAAAELATALWSGAHGICMLAVTGKLQVATQASVQRLLDVLLDRFLGARGQNAATGADYVAHRRNELRGLAPFPK